MEGMPLADVRNRAWRARLFFLSMRVLPWIGARNMISPLLAAALGARHRLHERFPAAAEDAGLLAELGKTGLALVPPVLTAQQIEEMTGFLGERDLVAKDGRRFRTENVPGGVRTGSYPLDTVLHCPHVLELINSPQLIRLAVNHLGCVPTISGLRIDWSAPSNGNPSYVQQFHRDHDDWRFLKLLVYLTDVDADAGPHEFVKTSHLHSGRLTRRPYEQDEVERQYGKERIISVQGQKGTSFLADTWGIHKGNVPTTKPRLMLQVQYSLLPVWRYAYHPVQMPLPPEYDAYINRLIVSPSTDNPEHLPRSGGDTARLPASTLDAPRDMGGIITG